MRSIIVVDDEAMVIKDSPEDASWPELAEKFFDALSGVGFVLPAASYELRAVLEEFHEDCIQAKYAEKEVEE